MKTTITILLLIGLFSTYAQNKTLVIRHKTYFKRELFYIGDPIRFYVKNDNVPISGNITDLSDSSITVKYAVEISDNEGYARQEYDTNILLKDIAVVSLKHHKRKFGIGPREISAYVGGFGLFMVGQSIYTWIREGDPHTKYLITGAGIFTLAQIPRLVQRKKYVIGKKWTLSVSEW